MNTAKRLMHVIEKSERIIIGLMSGMSMDGVNLTCAKISGTPPDLSIEVLGTYKRPYSSEVRSLLKESRDAPTAMVAHVNFLVASEFANCVNDYLALAKLQAVPDAIGSHGQTIFHSPKLTLQVGDPSLIAEWTGLLTIGNFRVRDMAVGGCGAPLVAFADSLSWHDSKGYNSAYAFNNLGSISNVSVMDPKTKRLLAFDTGPANLAIDYYAAKIKGNHEGIDMNGSFSARGKVIPGLLIDLLAQPFFSQPPPKAAGYDEFGPVMLEELYKKWRGYCGEDYVATAVEFAANTITDAYQKFVLPNFPSLKRIVFSGGGVFNETLMLRIRTLMATLSNFDIQSMTPEDAEGREALAFAILANETLSGRAGNVPQATGAKKAVVLGEIAL